MNKLLAKRAALQKRRGGKKGFTLVELVIVIAILAILAAIAIPTVSGIIRTANENVDRSNAQAIELAVKSSYTELQAGTWDGSGLGGANATAATLTVAQALTHNGMDPALLTSTRTGNKFVFNNGKVMIQLNNEQGTDLTGATLCSTVVEV